MSVETLQTNAETIETLTPRLDAILPPSEFGDPTTESTRAMLVRLGATTVEAHQALAKNPNSNVDVRDLDQRLQDNITVFLEDARDDLKIDIDILKTEPLAQELMKAGEIELLKMQRQEAEEKQASIRLQLDENEEERLRLQTELAHNKNEIGDLDKQIGDLPQTAILEAMDLPEAQQHTHTQKKFGRQTIESIKSAFHLPAAH